MNVRVPADLKARATDAARSRGVTLQALVAEALEAFIVQGANRRSNFRCCSSPATPGLPEGGSVVPPVLAYGDGARSSLYRYAVVLTQLKPTQLWILLIRFPAQQGQIFLGYIPGVGPGPMDRKCSRLR